jgi:hypothetical protein
MLHLLKAESNQIPHHEQELLEGLDKVLSAIHVPGEFIWDQELRDGFPPQTFPYLYGTLKS